MKKYILDTNITSLLGSEKQVDNILLNKLYELEDDDIIMVSIITLYETNYGLKNSVDEIQKREISKNLDFIKKFFEIVPLDLKEMDIYADLKVLYKKHTGINQKSMKKNDLDILIASTAIAKNATLISNDKIFEKLSEIEPKFKWENWLNNDTDKK